MSQEKLISIGQFFMEPALQLVCKELNTQEVLVVPFSTYSRGMVVFIVAGENPQAMFLDGSENISKDI